MRSVKKPNIIFKINENFKYQLITCVLLSSVIIVCFYVAYKIIDVKKMREYNIVEDYKLVNTIEQVSIKNNRIILRGYAFMSDRDSTDNTISVFLRSVDSGKEIWLDMEQIERPDVKAYFEGEHDYGNSGFIASTDIDKINQDDVYEVVINIDYAKDDGIGKTRTTVSTHKHLLNNELYTYNPREFIKPDTSIQSETLKKVFEKGHLCFYQNDVGMYVYQYDGKLYWIVTEDFEFNDEGSTYIIYHLFTTQNDKLPERRIKHKFDNLDFYFEKIEFTEENTSPYRVAFRDIPQEYAITYITTGVYDYVNKKSYWTKKFHLNNIINLTSN